MITREKEPLNLEMPFGSLDRFITPTERFYVRCHFPIPKVDEQGWKLHLEGLVEKPVHFSLADLRQQPLETISATIECAGNGRAFLVPKVKGVQWELGAVGNAEWRGVRLRHLLEQAQVRPEAREIVLEGSDKGAIAELPRPAGEIHFARSLPISKAMDDVLLALEINGRPLPPAHGFPLRAVVPGWYGMASVKWLQRIIVTDHPFNGYYQTIDYAYWQRRESGPTLMPISAMQTKAQMSRPEPNEIISAGVNYLIRGAAWAGEAEIVKVEVSDNSGSSWRAAKLEGQPSTNSWRLWQLEWDAPSPGNYTLIARATDSLARIQPFERSPDNGTYMINHCLPISIEVR